MWLNLRARRIDRGDIVGPGVVAQANPPRLVPASKVAARAARRQGRYCLFIHASPSSLVCVSDNGGDRRRRLTVPWSERLNRRHVRYAFVSSAAESGVTARPSGMPTEAKSIEWPVMAPRSVNSPDGPDVPGLWPRHGMAMASVGGSAELPQTGPKQ